jgi:predicted alpha/beta-fold hydrolase
VHGYRAPWWLPGPHLQTLYPALALRGRPPRYRRTRWELPDGDFIDVDHVDGPPDMPLVVLFHGLEGSSASHYATALMRRVQAEGWRGAVPHFRGCSGEPNRLPRAYHSGDADEVALVVSRMAAAEQAPLFVAGVSLGGNALLKWLGRARGAARSQVAAAAAICAPVDLVAAGAALGTGFNRLYTRAFLRTLKPKALAMLERFPGLFDPRTMHRARNFDVFDDIFTAPLHGYRGVHDYWSRASSKPDLAHVEVPTLVLNPRNDPFLPARFLPGPDEISPHVLLEQPRGGGHVGFVSGAFPGHVRWLPERLLGFFRAHLSVAEAPDHGRAQAPAP